MNWRALDTPKAIRGKMTKVIWRLEFRRVPIVHGPIHLPRRNEEKMDFRQCELVAAELVGFPKHPGKDDPSHERNPRSSGASDHDPPVTAKEERKIPICARSLLVAKGLLGSGYQTEDIALTRRCSRPATASLLLTPQRGFGSLQPWRLGAPAVPVG